MTISPALAQTPSRSYAAAARSLARATRRAAGWLYAAQTLAFVAPALIWPVPRAGDLVNHWARLTLLGSAPENPLHEFYETHWGAIPNLGVDLLYLALAPWLAPLSVVKLAWALSLLLPALGAWAVHRALFRTPQVAILLAPLLSYNLVTTTGLVNIGMGLGLALLLVAWRLRLRDKASLGHMALFNLAALAVLACHIIALGLLALTLGLMEVSPRRGEPWRRALVRGLASPRFVAAGLLAALACEKTPAGLAYAGAKWQALTAPFLAMSASDLPLMEIVGLALGFALFKRQIGVSPRLRWTAAALAVLVLVAPSTFGAGVLLDARLAVFASYLTLASLRWPWRGGAGAAVPLLALGLTALRVGALAPEWAAYNAALTETRATIASLPEAKRVLALRPPAKTCADPDLPFLANLAPLAVIDRRDFVNSLFALPGVQPVRPRDPALREAPNMAWDASFLTPEGQTRLGPLRGTAWAKALLDWRAHFDAVLLMHGRCDWRMQAADLETLAEGRGVTAYRLRR